MASGGLTIHGGTGSGAINFAFTVYGTNTLRYATSFANQVNALLASGENTTPLQPNSGDQTPAKSTPIDVLQPSTVAGSAPSYDPSANAYVLDSIGGALTIDLSGGDTVLVAAINARATINSAGGDNQITFVDGNNTYNAGINENGDVIVAGTGFDTINTGTGFTTVDSGTGDATIYLNDIGAGFYNDDVYLDDGKSIVYANGTGDQIVATTAGQTIIGGAADSSSVLTVVLLPNSDGTANGNDSVSTGSAYANVIDESSNNTVIGGAGGMTFYSGAGITGTVETGIGLSVLFGNTGVDLTLLASSLAGGTGGNAAFVAGMGNETLNGAGATANLTLFGGTDASGSDSLVGGAGSDTLVAGMGSETLAGGAGANSFLVDATGAAGANITIADFNASDTLAFSGYSSSDVANALSSGVQTSDGFVITFDSTNTTITLTGETSGGLTGHTITFG